MIDKEGLQLDFPNCGTAGKKSDFPAFPVFPAESVVLRLKTDPMGRASHVVMPFHYISMVILSSYMI